MNPYMSVVASVAFPVAVAGLIALWMICIDHWDDL